MRQHDPSIGEAPAAWRRVAAGSGLAFGGLMFAAGFLFELPRPDLSASSEAIQRWAQANQTAILTNRYLQLLAGLCFVVFAAGLYDAIRGARRGADLLGLVALAAAVATGVSGSVKIGADLAFLRLALDGGAPEVLRALKLLAAASQDILGFWQGLFWLAASLAILRTGVAPRWTAILGLVGTAALALSTATVIDPESPLGIAGFLVFFLFTAWMVATPVSLLLRSRTRRAAGEMRVATA